MVEEHLHLEYQSSINVKGNYENAFWCGQTVYSGNTSGDSIFTSMETPFTAGYTVTHGLLGFTTFELKYDGESGSLIEATSDIFGFCLEHYIGTTSHIGLTDPLHKKRFWLADFGFIRDGLGELYEWHNMLHPHKTRISHPNYGGYQKDDYLNIYTGDEDYQGIHINAGIGNRAFAVMVDISAYSYTDKRVFLFQFMRLWYSTLIKLIGEECKILNFRLFANKMTEEQVPELHDACVTGWKTVNVL